MSKRVLICDDEADIAGIVGAYFESLGYAATLETNPMAALRRIEREEFDLITLDYLMPELNGRATLERMAQLRPNLKFLLITGLDEEDSRLQDVRSTPLPASILCKPFLLKDLLGALQRIGILEHA